jgi:hypothetical protein
MYQDVGNVTVPVNVGSVNIVVLDSLVTLPSPTSEAVMDIFPVRALLFTVLDVGTYSVDNEAPLTVISFVVSTLVNQPLVILDPVAPKEPVRRRLLAPSDRLPPDRDS